MSESLVDLLLVRLGREEEKRKVLKLLVTSLDLSVSDAEEAVNNSPSVIREAVPMGEARVIQKDLYPYIDLLPRFNDDDEVDEEPEESAVSEPDDPAEEIPESDDDEDEIDEDEIEEDEIEEQQPQEEENAEEEEEETEDFMAVGDDPILITSASDEVRSTTRCHICGRTPTDGEKLAPCRTCGDLTCRDCFDRMAHVCSKCAASGKSVEHANDGVEPEKDEGLVFDTVEEEPRAKSSGSSIGRYIAVGVLFIIALATVFYFMDPMNLFGEDNLDSGTEVVPVSDTTSSAEDSLQILEPDTAGITSDTLDTVEPVDLTEDPVGITSLTLSDEYSAIVNPPPVVFRTRAPSSIDAVVLQDEFGVLEEHLSVIAAWIPVELDDAVLLQYHDTTQVLVLVLRHPEETEIRLELLRRTAQWLSPSGIDQLVLLYRENRYQNTVIMSLLSPVFTQVQGVLSPSQFNDYLGYREDCWGSISGPVSEWLTEVQ